ncbi:NAD(P)-binding protein [Xylariaceae sp. FL0016]|nr:NAD(P)-binding protein [Xylariaceae sp. FL0016]
MTFHPNTLPDLRGKVFIVTGGNSGIGYHIVAHLAEHGAHVYMCARSSEKGTTAIANIRKMHPSASIDLLQMDLKDLSSVTALHGLVNNAGIMATPFGMTKDGHEAQWQTNYLAHWVLTQRLLPLMLQTAKQLPPGSVRIVNLTSAGHMGAPRDGISFDDASMDNNSIWARYGQSKLANILHTRILHKTYGPGSPSASRGEGEIWVSSVHPGVVDMNLSSNMEQLGWFSMPGLITALKKTGLCYPADKGAWTSLFCAASQDMESKQSGAYLEIHRRFGEPCWQSSAAKDEKLAERLEGWTTDVMRKKGWVE